MLELLALTALLVAAVTISVTVTLWMTSHGLKP